MQTNVRSKKITRKLLRSLHLFRPFSRWRAIRIIIIFNLIFICTLRSWNAFAFSSLFLPFTLEIEIESFGCHRIGDDAENTEEKWNNLYYNDLEISDLKGKCDERQWKSEERKTMHTSDAALSTPCESLDRRYVSNRRESVRVHNLNHFWFNAFPRDFHTNSLIASYAFYSIRSSIPHFFLFFSHAWSESSSTSSFWLVGWLDGRDQWPRKTF